MTQEQHHRPTTFEIEHLVQTQKVYQHVRCKTIIHIQDLAKADLAATEAVDRNEAAESSASKQYAR